MDSIAPNPTALAARRGRGLLRRAGQATVDYALPPRCAGCGVIVAGDDQLCLDCWSSLDFLDGPACARCSIPLPDTGAPVLPDALCGACLAKPAPFAGAPAALAYGKVARHVALRLKYGRRLGHARLMATLMQRRLEQLDRGLPMVLVPVPLHRWRLWARGFNQAALIANRLAEGRAVAVDATVIVRARRTPSLRGLSARERDKAVRGAFALAADARARLAGRHVVLIDDVHASGATLRACARLLRRGGAAEVSALSWARVVAGRGLDRDSDQLAI